MGEELNTQSLSTMIQKWVHFDNLAATFTRQAQQARTVKYKWEVQVLEYLQKTKMTNAIIQITGGRLTVNEQKTANPLTLQKLEQLLQDYFTKKPPGSTDETADILAFIKANRGAVIETRLKKH